ncbi:Lcl C-terminal domain-containing protein [Hydrogenimonas sp.]
MKKTLFALLAAASFLSAAYLRDDASEIVTDDTAGVMWQDSADVATERVTWSEAVERCRTLRLGGFDDWRLPERDELDSLADEQRFKHGIDPVFRYEGDAGYWSSTVDPVHPDSAWRTLYTCGGGYWYGKKGRAHVRCIRKADKKEPPAAR